jgi:hypothetical protein
MGQPERRTRLGNCLGRVLETQPKVESEGTNLPFFPGSGRRTVPTADGDCIAAFDLNVSLAISVPA